MQSILDMSPTMVHDYAAPSIHFDGTSNRRSACDRCRSHKLRCERHPASLQCRRCVKADAACITGATLKSGRPPHLYSTQRQQRRFDVANHQESHAHTDHQQTLPDFPTPTPTTFDTHFEAIPTEYDGGLDMQFLASPGSFNGLDEIWIGRLEQDTTAARLALPVVTSTTQTGDGAHFDPPPDIRSKYLKKLGDLQADVLVDLEAIKACTTADKCPQAATNFDAGRSPDFLVGRMLDHSAALVEVIDCFEPTSTNLRPLSNGNGSSIGQAPRGLRCDVPTMFSLLSCYVCLTRIYRTIFSCIHDSMPFLLVLEPPVPQLFPGLSLGGFKLEGRLDLQVQILIQVSEDMLAKFEARFGIAEDPAAANGSIFEHEKAAKMLRVMLEEEAKEQPQLDERRGDCESLRNILASLKRMIQMAGVKNNG